MAVEDIGAAEEAEEAQAGLSIRWEWMQTQPMGGVLPPAALRLPGLERKTRDPERK